jgi:hypothetical protein
MTHPNSTQQHQPTVENHKLTGSRRQALIPITLLECRQGFSRMKRCSRCGRDCPSAYEQCDCGSELFAPSPEDEQFTAKVPDLPAHSASGYGTAFQVSSHVPDWERRLAVPPSCPGCFQETTSLKTYRFTNIYCWFAVVQWTREEVSSCPRCMRSHLLWRGLKSIITANIFWPCFVLPNLVFRWLATFKAGHAAPKRTTALGCLYAGIFLSGGLFVFGLFVLAIGLSERIVWPVLVMIGVVLTLLLLLFLLFSWLAINAEIRN